MPKKNIIGWSILAAVAGLLFAAAWYAIGMPMAVTAFAVGATGSWLVYFAVRMTNSKDQ